MIGPIRGRRLSPEVKLRIVRAIASAKQHGMTVERACRVILLDPRRLRRWIAGREVAGLTEAGLTDRPPVARRRPHALTEAERAEILAGAGEEDLANERHRKLTHHLSRQGRFFCS